MPTCIDCEQPAEVRRRERCRSCYRRHIKALKRDDKFSSRTDPLVGFSVADRLLARAKKADNGCWLYRRSLNEEGYGRIDDGTGRTVHAHRAAYMTFVDAIPDGHHIDHECHNQDLTCPGGRTCTHRQCINPSHLRAVVPAVNILSGRTTAAKNAAKTHCPKGHEYSAANTQVSKGSRRCRTCSRSYSRPGQPDVKVVTAGMTHGKRSTYSKGGCRCDLCKAAERARGRARRAAARSANSL